MHVCGKMEKKRNLSGGKGGGSGRREGGGKIYQSRGREGLGGERE